MDSAEVGIGSDGDSSQSQVADAGWTSTRPLHPERKPTTNGLGSVCCLELGGVLGIPRSPFGHIADSTDLLAGSWGGGPAGHAEAAVSLDSFEAAGCAGVLPLLAAPGIQRLRYWMVIKVSWSRRVATLQYTSLEEATSTPMFVDQSSTSA